MAISGWSLSLDINLYSLQINDSRFSLRDFSSIDYCTKWGYKYEILDPCLPLKNLAFPGTPPMQPIKMGSSISLRSLSYYFYSMAFYPNLVVTISMIFFCYVFL